nr:hypothetical protein [Leuven Tombus-like virus 1]
MRLDSLKIFKRKLRPWTRQQYVDNIDIPAKRKFYQSWLDQINNGYPIRSDVCPFTKLEKYSTTKYKAPRLIQARHPTFNIEYGRYIKPLERALKDDVHFGKGCYDNIANKIYRMSKKYRYYTECDHSTFDARVTPEMLRLTHRFYLSCFQNDPELHKLCERTVNNRCKTRNGEKYRFRGSRMSGDVDTSFGNSLLNYHILTAALRACGYTADVVVNGDDSVIFTNVPINRPVLAAKLLCYNMVSVILPSVTSIHNVEFCRTKLILHPDGHPTMMFDPNRLKMIYGMTYRPYPFHIYEKYLMQVHHANYMINLNSPIHRQWQKLDKSSYRIGDKIDLMVTDLKYIQHIIILELKKQLSNKPYTYNYLTPSIVEAYPDFQIPTQTYKIYQTPTLQSHMIISHVTKELLLC